MSSLTFRCKRCRKAFPLEQHPSPAYKEYLKESDNNEREDSSTDGLNKFVTKLKKVTESIRCPECQGGVYLIDIAGIIRDVEWDFTSEPIVQSIHSAVDYLRKGDYAEYENAQKEIIEKTLSG